MKKIFKKNRNIIIGALHFPPLLGHIGDPGMATAKKHALADLRALEAGGVDAIFIENNYGKAGEKISPPEIAAFSVLAEFISERATVPLGVSVLWNDYEVAFAIAKSITAKFIRIPVFVDTIKTYCGTIKGNARHVKDVQKKIGAENVSILADIHVKHSEILSKKSITRSAGDAIRGGADGIILTGSWTGQMPDMDELEKVRKAVGDFPIFIGSGASVDNAKQLLSVANGVIVSTSLKSGSTKAGERNVKGYEQRISKRKVEEFRLVVSHAKK